MRWPAWLQRFRAAPAGGRRPYGLPPLWRQVRPPAGTEGCAAPTPPRRPGAASSTPADALPDLAQAVHLLGGPLGGLAPDAREREQRRELGRALGRAAWPRLRPVLGAPADAERVARAALEDACGTLAAWSLPTPIPERRAWGERLLRAAVDIGAAGSGPPLLERALAAGRASHPAPWRGQLERGLLRLLLAQLEPGTAALLGADVTPGEADRQNE